MKLTNTILQTVHDLLATSPSLRNSDQQLICAVWATLHPHRVFNAQERPLKCFAIKDIMDLFESTETICRSRRIIQNELGLLLPTDHKIIKQRRINEETMREWTSNNFTPAQTKKILTEYLNAKNNSKTNRK